MSMGMVYRSVGHKKGLKRPRTTSWNMTWGPIYPQEVPGSTESTDCRTEILSLQDAQILTLYAANLAQISFLGHGTVIYEYFFGIYFKF